MEASCRLEMNQQNKASKLIKHALLSSLTTHSTGNAEKYTQAQKASGENKHQDELNKYQLSLFMPRTTYNTTLINIKMDQKRTKHEK